MERFVANNDQCYWSKKHFCSASAPNGVVEINARNFVSVLSAVLALLELSVREGLRLGGLFVLQLVLSHGWIAHGVADHHAIFGCSRGPSSRVWQPGK